MNMCNSKKNGRNNYIAKQIKKKMNTKTDTQKDIEQKALDYGFLHGSFETK